VEKPASKQEQLQIGNRAGAGYKERATVAMLSYID
jgi:hypothetical protein